MREPVFTETLQIAIVVRDFEAAMRTYVHDYGIGLQRHARRRRRAGE